ncbi:MAG: hypothetical protein ACYCXF_07895 [Thermoleophilia bacterium]
MIAILVLTGGAAIINLPFGFYRGGVRKYSWRWFLAIHLPIPLLLVTRLELGISWHIIPFVFACALLGQITGGMLRRGPADSLLSTSAGTED